MDLTVCPAEVITAPVEIVWELISDPELRDTWWHARTERVVPDGKASAGQIIYLKKPLGRRGTLKIETVDPEKHQIHWVLSGLGVTNDQTTTCTALDAASCRVQFG